MTPARIAGVLACALATLAASLSSAPAATSGSVVGATVLSAISLDDTGCRAQGALETASLPINTWWIGDPCVLSFGSSNDTARLRMWQRDEQGDALESRSRTWTPISGAAYWNAIAAGTTAGYAWAGGSGGPGEPSARLEKTVDGGATWTSQTTCNGGAPSDIERISDTELFLLTSGAICRTVDGGANWVTVFTGSSMARLDMVTATLGYAVGAGNKVYKTVNGTTWSQVYAHPTFTYLGAISATAGGSVVVSGRISALPNSTFGVATSLDGGATFATTVLDVSPGTDTYGVFGAYAVTDSTLIASMPRAGTQRSTDSGATWTQVNGGTFSGEPFRRSDGVLFVPIGGDSIASSADSGATWSSVALGTGYGSHNREVSGNGLSELWVAGYSDRRLHSTDAGASWTGISPPKPSWNAVAAWSGTTWVAAGSLGTGARTTDAGATVTSVTVATGTVLDAVTWPDGGGFAVGNNTMSRTTDRGATWTPVTPPIAGVAWTEVERDDEQRLWVTTDTGRVASSTDRGATWTVHAVVPGAPSISALTVWRGRIWVGGPAGAVWWSSTAGAIAWTAAPTGRTMPVISLWAISASEVVALTAYDTPADTSHASRSSDGGATWTTTPLTIKHTREIAIDDAHRHAVVTTSSSYIESEDRGLTWSASASVGVSQYIQRMALLSGGRIVAVGESSLQSRSSAMSTFPDGMAGAGSGFGACLETSAGTASNGWTLAGAGNCTAAVTANWTAIADDATAPTAIIATTPTTGTGVLGLRFGMRTSSSQPAGSYAATLVFEAVAPGT